MITIVNLLLHLRVLWYAGLKLTSVRLSSHGYTSRRFGFLQSLSWGTAWRIKLFHIEMYVVRYMTSMFVFNRYGLPVNFQAMLLQPSKKNVKKLREVLQDLYKHLDSSATVIDVSYITSQKFWITIKFCVFQRSLSCSPRLHLFDKNTAKTVILSNINK